MRQDIEANVGGWQIGEKGRHMPTGIVGRVVGLYVGLHSVQLQLEYTDKVDALREDWFAINECEGVE